MPKYIYRKKQLRELTTESAICRNACPIWKVGERASGRSDLVFLAPDNTRDQLGDETTYRIVGATSST